MLRDSRDPHPGAGLYTVKAVTREVFPVLKHTQNLKKCKKSYYVQFNKRLHGSIQHIQKQTHLLQFLDIV